MHAEPAIRENIRLVWRNLPEAHSTFSNCIRDCGAASRGGGVCLSCAQADLAKLTKPHLAAEYVAGVLNIRRLEREMLECAT
jgi:hypothetical protein